MKPDAANVPVHLLGPSDALPVGISVELRNQAPARYRFLVAARFAHVDLCMAAPTPERALAAAHAAAELVEDTGQHPRVIVASQARRLVDGALRVLADGLDEGWHRARVDAARSRWDAIARQLGVLPEQPGRTGRGSTDAIKR